MKFRHAIMVSLFLIAGTAEASAFSMGFRWCGSVRGIFTERRSQKGLRHCNSIWLILTPELQPWWRQRPV